MNGTINISGIECYAYHGCMEEEARIGQRYTVDVVLEMEMQKAVLSDNLDDTADYVNIQNIVKREMAVRSRLIEHVAGRILNALKISFPDIQALTVTIHKYNPPANAYLERASVTLTEKFSQ